MRPVFSRSIPCGTTNRVAAIEAPPEPRFASPPRNSREKCWLATLRVVLLGGFPASHLIPPMVTLFRSNGHLASSEVPRASNTNYNSNLRTAARLPFRKTCCFSKMKAHL